MTLGTGSNCVVCASFSGAVFNITVNASGSGGTSGGLASGEYATYADVSAALVDYRISGTETCVCSGFITHDDVSGFITHDDVSGFITSDDLSGLATEIDLEGYQVSGCYLPCSISGDWVVSVSGYATYDDVSTALTDYAISGEYIADFSGVVYDADISGYATLADLQAMSGDYAANAGFASSAYFATTFSGQAGYQVSGDFATHGQVSSVILTRAMSGAYLVASNLSGYALYSDVSAALTDYAISGDYIADLSGVVYDADLLGYQVSGCYLPCTLSGAWVGGAGYVSGDTAYLALPEYQVSGNYATVPVSGADYAKTATSATYANTAHAIDVAISGADWAATVSGAAGYYVTNLSGYMISGFSTYFATSGSIMTRQVSGAYVTAPVSGADWAKTVSGAAGYYVTNLSGYFVSSTLFSVSGTLYYVSGSPTLAIAADVSSALATKFTSGTLFSVSGSPLFSTSGSPLLATAAGVSSALQNISGASWAQTVSGAAGYYASGNAAFFGNTVIGGTAGISGLLTVGNGMTAIGTTSARVITTSGITDYGPASVSGLFTAGAGINCPATISSLFVAASGIICGGTMSATTYGGGLWGQRIPAGSTGIYGLSGSILTHQLGTASSVFVVTMLSSLNLGSGHIWIVGTSNATVTVATSVSGCGVYIMGMRWYQ